MYSLILQTISVISVLLLIWSVGDIGLKLCERSYYTDRDMEADQMWKSGMILFLLALFAMIMAIVFIF